MPFFFFFFLKKFQKKKKKKNPIWLLENRRFQNMERFTLSNCRHGYVCKDAQFYQMLNFVLKSLFFFQTTRFETAKSNRHYT
jgi:hypothetical protein